MVSRQHMTKTKLPSGEGDNEMKRLILQTLSLATVITTILLVGCSNEPKTSVSAPKSPSFSGGWIKRYGVHTHSRSRSNA